MEEKDFWNKHSLRFLEMAYASENRERLEHPDGYGIRTGDCGDWVEFFIMVDQGILHQISFEVDGCLNTMACCNTVIHLASGLTVEKAWAVTPDQVDAYLETLPADHYHCAELCVGGFYLALSAYGKSRSR